jgi:hypothetical protein
MNKVDNQLGISQDVVRSTQELRGQRESKGKRSSRGFPPNLMQSGQALPGYVRTCSTIQQIAHLPCYDWQCERRTR